MDYLSTKQPRTQILVSYRKKKIKIKSISSGAQYVTCTVKLDEEKSNYTGLPQEYGFGSAELFSLCNACPGKECNKYDLTAGTWLTNKSVVNMI